GANIDAMAQLGLERECRVVASGAMAAHLDDITIADPSGHADQAVQSTAILDGEVHANALRSAIDLDFLEIDLQIRKTIALCGHDRDRQAVGRWAARIPGGGTQPTSNGQRQARIECEVASVTKVERIWPCQQPSLTTCDQLPGSVQRRLLDRARMRRRFNRQ